MAKTSEEAKEAVKEIDENDYLEKTHYLKLIPKSQGMEVAKNPQHIGFGGMFDGAVVKFNLYMDEKTMKIVNPFKSREEQEFFEKILGNVDLNCNNYKKENCYWYNYGLTVIKSPEVIEIGHRLIGSNPEDALAIKVLRTCKNLVAPSWEERFNKGTYKWVLVPEDYEEEKAGIEIDIQKKIWMHLGSIDSSTTKMQDFLSIYYAGKGKTKKVPADASKEFLVKELSLIIAEDTEGYIKVVDDKDFEMKVFINKSIDKGTIVKFGAVTYNIVGYEPEYTYLELVSYLKELKKRTDPLWIKLNGQLED